MSENCEDTCVISKHDKSNGEDNDEHESDPQYDPIISLPEMEVPTLEEEEIVLVNLRAKVYRYDSSENPPEWKERGTGNVKILHHKTKDTVRIVMRRDRTLKLCANHFITPPMELKPSASCERAWVYSVKADYIDETAKSQLLAIKFANIESAQKWKDAFEKAKRIVLAKGNASNNEAHEDEKKILDDALKLNDTFEDEKKNSSLSKEENCHLIGSEKHSNIEIVEKLDSLTVKESDEGQKTS